jgi:hypothetical protein
MFFTRLFDSSKITQCPAFRPLRGAPKNLCPLERRCVQRIAAIHQADLEATNAVKHPA